MHFRSFASTGLILLTAVSLSFATTGDIIKAFPVPGTCPTGLAWDGGSLWLADLKTDLFYQISPQDGSVLREIPAPTYRPLGLCYDGEALWCIDGEEERLLRIDPETGLVTKNFESPVPQPTGLTWDGQYLWLASRGLKELHQLSTIDGTTIVSFASPSGSPQGLAFDGNYLWVADRIRNRIYMVNPTGGEVIVMFDAPAPYADGLAWDGKNLWNADFQSDSLYCLQIGEGELYTRKDCKTQQVTFTHEVRNYGPGTMNSLDIFIALPRDYTNQELIGELAYNPAPTDFLTDQWDQKVAHWHFADSEAGALHSVALTAQANLYDTRFFIFPEKVGSLKDIPKDIKKLYLVDDEKFDLQNPIIQNILQEEVGDEKNPYWIMRKIFNAVIDRVDYELSGGWNTAPTVIDRGTGSCSEYTFAFIALCRAAGLPARYTGSIAIRGDDASLDDVFHRWAEVYLPNYGWIP
ncbi:transglutaminase, partial [bacterium]|nr:transglutaminase [bacterium]